MSDEIIGHNGEVDLLQQALAGASGVLSDSNTLPETETLDQNELLSILQSDHTSQTIQITAEQAAALGLHIVEPDNILEPELRHDESSNRILEVDEIPIKIQNETNHIPTLTTVPIVFTNESLTNQATINNILKKLNYSVNDSSPLGTAKNPIKLVKKGGVFQSLQELTPEQLQQLQRSIPLKKISKHRLKSHCVTNYDANTQVVYRVVYPEEVDLQVPHRGRPGKRGRPRKRKTASTSSLSVPVLRPMRTRSGRLTKPPGYKSKNFKQIGEIEESDTENSEVKRIEHQNDDPKDVIKTDDKSTEQQINEQKLHTGVQMIKRNIPAQFRCPTCNKAYLGYSKIENHIRQHPDHGPIPPKPKPTLLWDTALRISRTQLAGNRAQTFLHELAHLTRNVRRVAPKLLSRCGQGANFEVDDSLSGLLGVPSGIYSINEQAMEEIIKSEKNKKTENHETDNYLSQNGGECLQEQLLNVQISHGDENDESHELMLPMVDTGQVPMVLDTSASSDEVMNVDQLVSERFQSFTNGDLPTAPSQPPPSSSNSSLSLDLSLDLFQFHSS